MKAIFLVNFVVVHLLDWAIWPMGALKKHMTCSRRQRTVASVMSQGKISVTANLPSLKVLVQVAKFS